MGSSTGRFGAPFRFRGLPDQCPCWSFHSKKGEGVALVVTSESPWIPAFAGMMTVVRNSERLKTSAPGMTDQFQLERAQ